MSMFDDPCIKKKPDEVNLMCRGSVIAGNRRDKIGPNFVFVYLNTPTLYFQGKLRILELRTYVS